MNYPQCSGGIFRRGSFLAISAHHYKTARARFALHGIWATSSIPHPLRRFYFAPYWQRRKIVNPNSSRTARRILVTHSGGEFLCRRIQIWA